MNEWLLGCEEVGGVGGETDTAFLFAGEITTHYFNSILTFRDKLVLHLLAIVLKCHKLGFGGKYAETQGRKYWKTVLSRFSIE